MSVSLPITIGFKITGRLCAAALCCLFFFSPSPAVAADRSGDEFLTGYITSILERNLHWETDSYILNIVDGVATITLFQEDPLRQEAVDTQLRAVEGLQRITITVQPADAGKPGVVNRMTGITDHGKAFPTGDLFRPLIADPNQPQFFAGLNYFTSADERYTSASVGFGETFGIYRFFGNREGDGLQLNVAAALFAQFNMETPSHDLINADYTIGIPVTYRYGDNSFRLRVYHQSSHLGDEFLQGVNPPDRVNLSFEAIELIYSLEWREWRGYAGGEYLIHKEPEDLKPMGAHWGIEYRGSQPLVWNGRPIAGIDLKSMEENNWPIDTSVKIGLEFGHPNPGQRRVRLMATWYKGYDPYGQFYNTIIEYYGLGVSLGF